MESLGTAVLSVKHEDDFITGGDTRIVTKTKPHTLLSDRKRKIHMVYNTVVSQCGDHSFGINTKDNARQRLRFRKTDLYPDLNFDGTVKEFEKAVYDELNKLNDVDELMAVESQLIINGYQNGRPKISILTTKNGTVTSEEKEHFAIAGYVSQKTRAEITKILTDNIINKRDVSVKRAAYVVDVCTNIANTRAFMSKDSKDNYIGGFSLVAASQPVGRPLNEDLDNLRFDDSIFEGWAPNKRVVFYKLSDLPDEIDYF